jgi:hypothetical protein
MQSFQDEIQQNLGHLESQNIQDMIKEFQKTSTIDPTTTTQFYAVLPLQGFVIKTKIKESKEYPKETKLFINLCYSPEIPQPPLVSKEEIIKAIQNDDSSKYKVPLSLSKPRSDLDKSISSLTKGGNVCLVFDACIHSQPYNETIQDIEFKYFIIDLAIAWVQEKYQMELSSKFTLPKMASKGQLVPHSIRKVRKPLVAEVPVVVEHNVADSTTTTKNTPTHLIVCEPEQDPKYIVIQVHLPILVFSD